MTDILRQPLPAETANFVFHALTEENISLELREMYGDDAFEGTVENAAAWKGEAIAHTITAPNTFDELKTAQTAYDKYLADLPVEERQRIEEAKRTAESSMGIPLVEDPAAVAAENTMTPDQYKGLDRVLRKENIRANPIKELWDESIEKDAGRPVKEFTKEGTAMILEAARQVALHPMREGDDLVALDFLAHTSDEPEGRVSQYILDKAKSHRRTRAILTSVLLRII
jgi:hypothetical protein